MIESFHSESQSLKLQSEKTNLQQKSQTQNMSLSEQKSHQGQILKLAQQVAQLNSQNQCAKNDKQKLLFKNSQLQRQLKIKDQQLKNAILQLAALQQKMKVQIAGLKSILKAKEADIFEAGRDNLRKDNIIEEKQHEIQMLTTQASFLKSELSTIRKGRTVLKVSENRKFAELQIEKKIKFNFQQLQELQRLDAENRLLVQENNELYNTVKLFKKDQDVSICSINSRMVQEKLEEKPHCGVKTEQSQVYRLNQSSLLEISKQSSQICGENNKTSNEGEPKKRKLLRKKPVQLDYDDQNMGEISLDSSELRTSQFKSILT